MRELNTHLKSLTFEDSSEALGHVYGLRRPAYPSLTADVYYAAKAFYISLVLILAYVNFRNATPNEYNESLVPVIDKFRYFADRCVAFYSPDLRYDSQPWKSRHSYPLCFL